MFIERLTTASGKIVDLCDGINGKGETIYGLQWMKVDPATGAVVGCYHQDNFKSEAEARLYVKHTA